MIQDDIYFSKHDYNRLRESAKEEAADVDVYSDDDDTEDVYGEDDIINHLGYDDFDIEDDDIGNYEGNIL